MDPALQVAGVGGKASNHRQDGWFIGFTHELVVATWVERGPGTAKALPVWARFWKLATTHGLPAANGTP